MRDLKKTLRLAGIFCMLALIINIASLLLNIFVYKFTVFDIIIDVTDIILTISTAILYFVFMTKPTGVIINNRNIFMVFAILNIFNNFIVWIIAFWVEIAVGQHMRAENFASMYREQNAEARSSENPDVVIIDDFEVHTKKNELVSRLEELNNSLEKNLITQEEYDRLRQEAIDKFMK